MSTQSRAFVVGYAIVGLSCCALLLLIGSHLPVRHPMAGVLVVCLCAAVFLAVGGYGLFFLQSLEQRDDIHHCRKCGYKLAGNNSGICSECGTPIRHS